MNEKTGDRFVDTIDKILDPVIKITDAVAKMPICGYVEITVIGLLIVTLGTTIASIGHIQLVYALLTVFILVLGLATAWEIHSSNEKKFLAVWNIPMTLCWVSAFITTYFSMSFIAITTCEAISLFLGSIPIIIALKSD